MQSMHDIKMISYNILCKKWNEKNFGYCVVGITRAAISVTVG